MNKIRINTEKEENLVDFKFKLPIAVVVLYIVLIILGIGAIIGGCFLVKVPATPEANTPALSAIVFIAGFILGPLMLFLFICRIIGFKSSVIYVSNKRIYGKYGLYFIRKSFSYRLDEINNVEIGQVLDSHTIVIQFEQGKGPKSRASYVSYGNTYKQLSGDGIFRIRCVVNYQEVYDKLTNLITSVKNQFDTEVDIEMSKIDVEKKKVEALDKVASSISAHGAVANDDSEIHEDYIVELKELKKLYDEDIITKDEYNERKKKILDSNHKYL